MILDNMRFLTKMENVIGAFFNPLRLLRFKLFKGEKTMKRSTKHSLLMSALSLLLCASMLIGTTFAWFTDSVTSTGNIIKSGTLDVALEWKEGNTDPADTTGWTDASTGAIFKNDKWEPGYTEVKHIRISNNGTLALKYQVNIIPYGDIDKLTDVIDVYYLDPAEQIANRDSLDGKTAMGNLTEAIANLGATGYGELEAKDSEVITIALKMRESAGNEYQNKSIGTDFAIQLVATQLEFEDDSFDKTYDKPAEYPEGTTIEDTASGVAVTVPLNAEKGMYSIDADHISTTADSEGLVTASYEIKLNKDGVPVVADAVVKYLVQIDIGVLLNISKVYHNGVEVEDYEYDPLTHIISFYTDSFSPFSVVYEELSIGGVVEDKKIVAGLFEANKDGVVYDPREIDVTLKNDTERLVLEYTKNGKTCYAVSKADETVILAAPDTVIPENLEGVKRIGENKLYAEISALQNNEHSTVYLLPGTYNEGTTINVYSSMDIIGLGDKDSVEVVKKSSSSSNRHLFNCSGTKAEYIEVTLRNLYLDATAKTTNNKDNAAVQSIRKSKVKCYDLTVIKGTEWDAVAFYVNGNNAVDGVKYPAYMYVENCDLNTTRTFGIVSTSGSYKFYHNDLTYNNGTAYTINSGSTKNVVMEADDWEW